MDFVGLSYLYQRGPERISDKVYWGYGKDLSLIRNDRSSGQISLPEKLTGMLKQGGKLNQARMLLKSIHTISLERRSLRAVATVLRSARQLNLMANANLSSDGLGLFLLY
jgi:hypothetical protein